MFHYFRNYSSNAHQLCCKDSPTKGLHDHYQSDDLDLHLRSQPSFEVTSVSQTWLLFNLQYLWQYFKSYYFQTWHDGRLMDAHARFNDLDLDTRSQWVGKGKQNQFWMLSATKQAISITWPRLCKRLTILVGVFFGSSLWLKIIFTVHVYIYIFNTLHV